MFTFSIDHVQSLSRSYQCFFPPQINIFSFDIFMEAGIPRDMIRYITLGLGVSEIITLISCVSYSPRVCQRTNGLSLLLLLFISSNSETFGSLRQINSNKLNLYFLPISLSGSDDWAYREEAIVVGGIWCHVCLLVVGNCHDEPEGKPVTFQFWYRCGNSLIIAPKVISILKCVIIHTYNISIHAGFQLLGSLSCCCFDHHLHHLLLWRAWYVL